jgi:hypothetical protein
LVAAGVTSKLVRWALRPATERCSYPGHRGENRRDESPIMKESDIMGVVEAKAHKSAA